jgi:acyl-CoA thioester hydrolase
MELYEKPIDIRWSDLDPNFHLRHSVYYDYGAYCRVCFLNENGLTGAYMAEKFLGPILLKEECVFRREVRMGELIRINLELVSSRSDYSRWKIRHNILKNDNVLAAVITVDGAWIDTNRRKLAVPDENVFAVFNEMPRAAEFEFTK